MWNKNTKSVASLLFSLVVLGLLGLYFWQAVVIPFTTTPPRPTFPQENPANSN